MISPANIDAPEEQQREMVVAEAKSWLGTPYHHAGRVKGAGVDCLTFLAEVFECAGLIEKVKIDYYPQDWHLHRSSERYLNGLFQHTREIESNPLPGDVVLWRFGRCFSHGAIVVQWPVVIHSYINVGVVLEDAEKAAYLRTVGENVEDKGRERPKRFFSYWGK